MSTFYGADATDGMAEAVRIARQARMLRPLLYVGFLITRKDSRTMLSEQVHETFVVSGLIAPTLEEHDVGKRHPLFERIFWLKRRIR